MNNLLFFGSVLTVLLAGCIQNTDAPARAQLASTLRDSIGTTADPQVAFLVHRKHLLVHLDSKAFTGVSDSAFIVKARDIALFSLRHYENAGSLDSITVQRREVIAPKHTMLIKQSHAFAVAELADHSE
jgi:hypothetical protein